MTIFFDSVSKSATNDDCGTPSNTLLESTSGIVASLLSPTDCPWTIRVAAHQLINLTIVDFSLAAASAADAENLDRRNFAAASAAAASSTTPATASSAAAALVTGGWTSAGATSASSGGFGGRPPCLPYAVISQELTAAATTGTTANGPAAINTTICRGRRRDDAVFVSKSNVVQVQISGGQFFVLKYEGNKFRSNSTEGAVRVEEILSGGWVRSVRNEVKGQQLPTRSVDRKCLKQNL